jgi:transcriptional regulator with XRE-family HTH domain
MKQDDAASRLQVSQSYISRLENGVIEPSPDIVSRLRELLHNPVHRPLVDQLRAIVRLSPHAVALLACEGDRVSVVEASARFRNAGPPFAAYSPDMDVTDPLGVVVAGLVRQVLDCGAFTGEIACVELVWQTELEGTMRYFHSVQTPVFTGTEWLVHSATAAMSAAGYEAFLSTNGGRELVHHF